MIMRKILEKLLLIMLLVFVTMNVALAADLADRTHVKLATEEVKLATEEVSLVCIPAIKCDDIETQKTAQTILEHIPGDPFSLDPDKNGIACDNKPKCTSVSSTFDADTEGWKQTHDGIYPAWDKTQGNPAGSFLVRDGQRGGQFRYAAPEKFLGDKSGCYGWELNFDLQMSSGGTWYSDAADHVMISDGTLTLRADAGKSPSRFGGWASYSVPIKESAWVNIATNAVATEKEMQTVLGNLTTLTIRGEYSGANTNGWLDNVRIIETEIPVVLDELPAIK